jgi:hypothetical protein
MADGDQFGSAVVAVGSRILIGALGVDTGATNAGAAYLVQANRRVTGENAWQALIGCRGLEPRNVKKVTTFVQLITHLTEVAEKFAGRIRVSMTPAQESRVEYLS